MLGPSAERDGVDCDPLRPALPRISTPRVRCTGRAEAERAGEMPEVARVRLKGVDARPRAQQHLVRVRVRVRIRVRVRVRVRGYG